MSENVKNIVENSDNTALELENQQQHVASKNDFSLDNLPPAPAPSIVTPYTGKRGL